MEKQFARMAKQGGSVRDLFVERPQCSSVQSESGVLYENRVVWISSFCLLFISPLQTALPMARKSHVPEPKYLTGLIFAVRHAIALNASGFYILYLLHEELSNHYPSSRFFEKKC